MVFSPFYMVFGRLWHPIWPYPFSIHICYSKIEIWAFPSVPFTNCIFWLLFVRILTHYVKKLTFELIKDTSIYNFFKFQNDRLNGCWVTYILSLSHVFRQHRYMCRGSILILVKQPMVKRLTSSFEIHVRIFIYTESILNFCQINEMYFV